MLIYLEFISLFENTENSSFLGSWNEDCNHDKSNIKAGKGIKKLKQIFFNYTQYEHIKVEQR